jgi:cobalt-precorrin 5A hydrolase
MKVAGFGFRNAASHTSLAEALALAGGAQGLPVIGLQRTLLETILTPTQSPRVKARFGTGSLAEAAALAAAGPGAQLLARRSQSADGAATAAIAEGRP